MDNPMLTIQVQLFSILREKLPPESKGRTVIQLDRGATIQNLLTKLDIQKRVAISINDVHERDLSRVLEDGDNVKIFTPLRGG